MSLNSSSEFSQRMQLGSDGEEGVKDVKVKVNKEAKVNREVKVDKEAKDKDKDIKEAEDKLNMVTGKEKNGEKVKLSEEKRDLKENMEKIHKVDDTNGVNHGPARTSL